VFSSLGSAERIRLKLETHPSLFYQGETNHHVGNIQYRQFVKACQPAYIAAKRKDKPFIAKRVVLAVRRLGGRFLKKDRDTNSWRDVGNSKAREKTSQALREGAPEIRGDPVFDAQGRRIHLKPSAVIPITAPLPKGGVNLALAASKLAAKKRPVEEVGEACAEARVEVPLKKRLLSLGDLADAASISPRSDKDLTVVPASFAATVSADDEEGTHNHQLLPPGLAVKALRGPSLKRRLKKRMESDELD
jgi:hypothetical protein